MAEPDITQNVSDVNQKPLKARHALFVQEYLLTKNASESCRRAGYSVSTASVMGSKLLKKPHIRAEVERLQAKELEETTQRVAEVLKERSKSSFIEDTYKSAEALPIDNPVRPRYLDLAGRALGFIGKDGATTTNNTLIVNVDAKSLPAGERWDRLRALIDGS